MRHSLTRFVLPLAAGAALSVASVAHADAASCELTPLELPLFGGTPVATLADPATPAAIDVDDAGIEAALEQYVACVNTGDPTLVWAMFSPRWFATEFADPSVHYLPAFEQMLAGPVMPADPPLELGSIDEIEMLPDGHVEATATFTSGDETWTDTLSLVSIGGQWMIDDVRLDAPAEDASR